MPQYTNILIDAIEETVANIVFMRLSFLYGFGDLDNFNLSDRRTQGNLYKEATRHAQWRRPTFKARGMMFGQIVSSLWCHSKEPAGLLDIGTWNTFSGLNAFSQNQVD